MRSGTPYGLSRCRVSRDGVSGADLVHDSLFINTKSAVHRSSVQINTHDVFVSNWSLSVSSDHSPRLSFVAVIVSTRLSAIAFTVFTSVSVIMVSVSISLSVSGSPTSLSLPLCPSS